MAYSVVTTVLSSAVDQNLTDLATAKAELSIADTSDDTWITGAIARVSSAMGNACNRKFVPELLRDSFDIGRDAYPAQTPGGFAALALTRWPVLLVQSLVQTTAPGTTVTLTEGTDFRVNYDTGLIERLDVWTGVVTTWEAMPVAVIYAAGFGVATVESHVVPASSPYTVAMAQQSAFACDIAVTLANGTALTRVNGTPGAGQYAASSTGYTFNAAQAGATVSFTYAARNVPGDLTDIALRLMSARYAARGRDPALVQRETPGVGMERWWFGNAPGQTGPFPPDIASALDFYALPAMA